MLLTGIIFIRLNLYGDSFNRLTVDKDILQVQDEGRQLLLKSRQTDLQNAIEETSAEIRKKNYDKFKFYGDCLIFFWVTYTSMN